MTIQDFRRGGKPAPTQLAERLGQLLKLLVGTDKQGEAIAALEAIKRTINGAGIDHHSLGDALEAGLARPQPRAALRPPPRGPRPPPPPSPPTVFTSWRAKVSFCLEHDDRLNQREAEFLDAMQDWCGSPSEKQLNWVDAIWRRLERRC
jgi:hypothetical protein